MTIHAPKLPSLAPRLALLAACVAIPLATAGCEDQQASGECARKLLGWRPYRPEVLEDLARGSYAR